jgi:hypothetical protein
MSFGKVFGQGFLAEVLQSGQSGEQEQQSRQQQPRIVRGSFTTDGSGVGLASAITVGASRWYVVDTDQPCMVYRAGSTLNVSGGPASTTINVTVAVIPDGQ